MNATAMHQRRRLRSARSRSVSSRVFAALAAASALLASPAPDAATLRGYTGGVNSYLLDGSVDGLTSFTAGIDGFTAEPLRASFTHTGPSTTEAFNVRVSSFGRGMNDLILRWEGEAFTNFSRSPGAWTNHGVLTDVGAVQTAEEFNGPGYYEVFLIFNTTIGAPRVALFDFRMFSFSPVGSEFDMVLVVNAGHPYTGGEPAPTPLPAGVWLLLSACATGAALARIRGTRAARV